MIVIDCPDYHLWLPLMTVSVTLIRQQLLAHRQQQRQQLRSRHEVSILSIVRGGGIGRLVHGEHGECSARIVQGKHGTHSK
jgi:hypothetical protein